jgi:hypothetical protein
MFLNTSFYKCHISSGISIISNLEPKLSTLIFSSKYSNFHRFSDVFIFSLLGCYFFRLGRANSGYIKEFMR